MDISFLDYVTDSVTGFGADELERAVKAFYKSRKSAEQTQQPVEEDLLFSDAPPTSSLVIDEAFLDAVWDWLQKHPEIVIKEIDHDPKSAPRSSQPGPRIFTTEERTWQVIAGHGVDYARLPKLMFECLSVVAAHGPDGVFQPALTQATGQDKRSVPGRTDLLAENGYIVKLPAYDGKNKTSLLKLRKFAENDGSSKPISLLERTRMYPEAESPPEENGLNSKKTFDEVIQMLNDNQGIVAIVDLCKAYKLKKYTLIKKDFLRQLDKLVESGCMRQVTAQVESGNSRYVTCLQLVTEPTERDRDLFTGKLSTPAATGADSDTLIDRNNNDNEEFAVNGENLEDGDEEEVEVSAQPSGRIPPQWTPDIPQNNLIFNLINKAGPAGISSMDLHKQSMGPFWKKSLDDLLLRLTDVWEISQPPHLRHLGIVRDTEVHGKSAHFHFRTLTNFEKAVELGLTAWEAVTSNSGGRKQAGKPASLSESSDLDQYGFPKFDPKLFADEEGRASLAECAKIPRRGRLQKGPDSTPKKPGPKPTIKDSSALSITTSTGNKKRSDSASTRMVIDSLAERDATPELTPTGKRKRKDAGIRRGPRGPYRKKLSPKSVAPTGYDSKLVRKDDATGALADTSGLSGASTVAGEKRSADTAQMNRPSRTRKVRKVTDTFSTPTQSGTNINNRQMIFQASASSNTAQENPANSLVSIDLPRAIALRFEGWHRPGRKPNTKIVAIKTKRLGELTWFDPYQVTAGPPQEDDWQDANINSPKVPNEQPVPALDVFEAADEPPQKKRRLLNDDVDGSPSSSAAATTPMVKKRPGRRRKSSDVAIVPARNAAAMPNGSSLDELEYTASESPASLLAKIPLRRSLLERFMQERPTINAELRDPVVVQSRIVGLPLTHSDPVLPTERTTRVVTLPLPDDLRRDIFSDDGDSSGSATGSAGATTNGANMFGSGLNIVRPYVGMRTKPINQPAKPNNLTNQSSNAFAPPDLASDPPESSSAFENASIHANGLSELLPADLEDEDEYRGKQNQKAGISRSGGFTHLHRIRIVMETMEKAGGVFPGDHEMWYPFTTAWQKKHPQFPDRRTVENTVNLQVKQGKLKKFSFNFDDKNGKTIQRHILTLPSVSPSSAKAKHVQQLIINSYPYRYLPKQVEITKGLRDRARQTTITQGGRRRKDDGDAKDEDTIYTPAPSSAKRRASGVSFDLRPQIGPIQTPMVRRVASFTPRSILKIRDNSRQPIDLEDDNFDSMSEFETESDSDEDGESLLEVGPEQSALQGSFDLDRYKHRVTATPRRRQGLRSMRTLKIDADADSAPSTPTITPRQAPSVPTIANSVQTFHIPTGTFGTLYSAKRKAGRRPNELDTTALYFGRQVAAPQNLGDIRQRAVSIGHRPASPTDSRFSQFKNEVDGVGEWEKSMTIDNQTMQPTSGTIFINHRLKQPHVLCKDSNVDFGYEFVDGSLKPFILENQRKKRPAGSQLADEQTATALGSGSVTPMAITSYDSPYASPYEGSFGLPSLAPTTNGTNVTVLASSFTPYIPFPAPTDTKKTKRRYEYKTRNNGNRRLAFDFADATAQLVDQDSDDDYRPGKRTSVKPAGEKSTGKKKPQYPKFSVDEFRRLALAVALARAICGGTEALQTTNYEAVALALGSRYEVEEVKHHWQLPRKHGYDKLWAIKVQQKMYEPFLQAYEGGELPTVDFDDLQSTDWPALLEWVKCVIMPLVEDEALDRLPAERSDVQTVMVHDLSGTGEETKGQDKLPDSPNLANDALAPARPRGQTKSKHSSALDQDYIMEKSWIRAVMTTKNDVYDEKAAATKLGSIDILTLEKATHEMLSTKTIKWKKVERQQPGRSYEISPYALSQFKRWSKPNGADYLESIAEARGVLVDHFEQHDHLELAVDVTEAQLEVLTNMVAQGHLNIEPILPGRNDDFAAPWPKLSKWGHINGTYETDPNELPSMDIKVAYKRTTLFTSDHRLRLDASAPTEVPVTAGEAGMRIPFWVDINGNVINEMWNNIVRSVLYLIVHAPACTAKSIEKAHGSKLWEWEINMVLMWMEEVGLATRIASVGDGWRASEWWYCASLLVPISSNEGANGEVEEE